MPKIRIDEAGELTVADITHAKFSALPATATIGEVRDWFAASASRRQAFVAEGILLGVVAVTGDMQSFCGTSSNAD